MSDYAELIGKRFQTRDRTGAMAKGVFIVEAVIDYNFGGDVGQKKAFKLHHPGNSFSAYPIQQFLDQFEPTPDKAEAATTTEPDKPKE